MLGISHAETAKSHKICTYRHQIIWYIYALILAPWSPPPDPRSWIHQRKFFAIRYVLYNFTCLLQLCFHPASATIIGSKAINYWSWNEHEVARARNRNRIHATRKYQLYKRVEILFCLNLFSWPRVLHDGFCSRQTQFWVLKCFQKTERARDLLQGPKRDQGKYHVFTFFVYESQFSKNNLKYYGQNWRTG